MDESSAWWRQAISDCAAAERERQAAAWCRAIAKYQQTVEKAIKAVVAGLREAGVTNVRVGPAHEVTPYLRPLLRLPRTGHSKAAQRQLGNLLDPATRAAILALESLAPRWPAPGEPPRRNTEYPFHGVEGAWTYPAAEDAFSVEEVETFRVLARRVMWGVERIIWAIRHVPK
jgi:hypothetical protein